MGFCCCCCWGWFFVGFLFVCFWFGFGFWFFFLSGKDNGIMCKMYGNLQQHLFFRISQKISWWSSRIWGLKRVFGFVLTDLIVMGWSRYINVWKDYDTKMYIFMRRNLIRYAFFMNACFILIFLQSAKSIAF